MGKRDRIRRAFKDLSKKSSASGPASTTLGTALVPGPTDRVHGASSTGNRSQDAPVRNLWNLALEKLPEEDKQAIISRINLDSKLDILQYLHTAAIQKQTECENQRWTFELNGRQIILRDVVEKIIAWINKFKQIGDIAVNFDPIHASLPWAGIRFLLEITVAESQQMGALLTGVEKMTDLIGRCQIYETLYLQMERFELEEECKQAVINLTSALVTLYASMLSFLGIAIRAYDQGLFIRTLGAIQQPTKVTDFIEKCESLEKNLAFQVDNCERIHTRRYQASSEKQIRELKEILADFQKPISRIDSGVAALCEEMDSSGRRKILGWISSIPYEENHGFAREGRTRGTGEWLLQHERYCEWRASSASMILWLHGDPGTGKTKLISTVVDDLLQRSKRLQDDEAFAYFYCDRNQSDRRDPTLILSSFVRQLSTCRNNDAIPRPTLNIYRQKQQTAFASGKLKSDESQALLADLFRIHPHITLVVDALDECDRNTRSNFIEILDKLIDESSRPVKILISSRRDRDIKRRFEDGPNLEIKAADNRDDIATFVNHEIKKGVWLDDTSFELKELIFSTLVNGSGGMFQWVSLQINALRELCRESDIRNRLGKLPKTLKAAYDELYIKIQSQEESTPVIANRAFQWVMCSCWPLSPAELVAAVCQDPDTDEIDETDINIDAVLGVCQNLLVVDQELNVCRFSHLSVQEYFETHHWNLCETDCLVGKVCLTFLLDNSATPKQHTQPMKKKGKDNSFRDILQYSCLNWVTHVQRLEENDIIDNRLTALLKRFLGSMNQSSLAYQNWHEMARLYFQNSTRFHELPLYRVRDLLSPCSRTSLGIVTFGFHRTLLDWWAFGFANVNQKNTLGDSLLLLGARRGSVSITEELLMKGAEVNAFGGSYGSALHAATYYGRQSVVQLLLEKGADVNISDGRFRSALTLASSFGHDSIVRLLLNNGADVNVSDQVYVSALTAASENDHESVVQLLLDNGADPNISGGDFGNALQVASFNGFEMVVQLLLDGGAEVNASGGNFGSALQAASYSGHESIVQLLVEKGADVNAPGGLYGCALQAASFVGFKQIVKLLLDNGADVNTLGGKYGSALSATLTSNQLSATNRSRRSIVQLLLSKGADVNAQGGESYGSPLQVASSSGFESIVQTLLDHGADINASGGDDGTALQAASDAGHESIIKLLLKNGADINAPGGILGSALQAAAYSGCKSIVQLLLEKGADINASGGIYGSAMQIASHRCFEGVVQLLQAATKPQEELSLPASELPPPEHILEG